MSHIDKIKDWQANPDRVADDGFEPPTPEVCAIAIGVLSLLYDRVVPDGEGGIAIEQDDGTNSKSLRIGPKGVEFIEFKNCRLVKRIKIGEY